jgi:hypothetical protein
MNLSYSVDTEFWPNPESNNIGLVIGRDGPGEEIGKEILADEVSTHAWDKYTQVYTYMHWRVINTKGENMG